MRAISGDAESALDGLYFPCARSRQVDSDALAAWAAGVVSELAKVYPAMPKGVEDRDADVWEPLLAVADSIGGAWPKRAREAAVSLVSAAREAEPSLGIRLLADLQAVFGTTEVMATTVILKALHDLPESPWNDLKGKPINDRGLAVRLRQYGIKSKQIRIGDLTCKGYARVDFFDAWKRYLPPSPPSSTESETSETSETEPDLQGSGVSDVSDDPSNVSDDVSEDLAAESVKSPDKTDPIPDVSDVSPAAEGEGDEEVF